MRKRAILTIYILFISIYNCLANEQKEGIDFNNLQTSDTIRWELGPENGIFWPVKEDKLLPHQDHLEMSGRQISAIIRYGADANRNLTLSRQIIWPMLRTQPKPTDPDWFKYRAYLKRTYGEEVSPAIKINGKDFKPSALSGVIIDGFLTFKHDTDNGITVTRTLFPSPDKKAFIEKWEIANIGTKPVKVEVASLAKEERETGVFGEYIIRTFVKSVKATEVKSGKTLTFPIVFTARKAIEKLPTIDIDSEEKARNTFIEKVSRNLVLSTPDPILNRAFALSKIRASESLFETKMGLVHSPGGNSYYGGIWANDQIEYAGPYFPFLGYEPAVKASLNAYQKFASVMKPDYARIPSSFEMEGDLTCCSHDRGDAAMYAFGASRFALATGKPQIAEDLWPAIAWSLEYTRRRTNANGVVESETDEMEGRLPTGKANLATSTIAYGGLRSAADLATALGKKDTAQLYNLRADELRKAIENYFGETVEGFKTYEYFEGYDTLRHWICLPLTMGIMERKEGTIDALFSKLWTPNGLAVQTGSHIFWDRGTLYALRGVFNAGETKTGLEYLKSYTRKRLTGNHVPYPVEAYPEGGQAHLSAESALYGRIFTEGIFGIKPTGLHTFQSIPQMPAEWPEMTLSNINAFGTTFNMTVKRAGKDIQVLVTADGKTVFNQTKPAGKTFEVKLAH